MLDLLRAECYKLLHSAVFWGMALLSLALGSILLLDSLHKTQSLLGASLYNTPLLYFIWILFTALFIGEDFENRTITSCLEAGHKRSGIFLVKCIVSQTAGILILTLPLLLHGLLDAAGGRPAWAFGPSLAADLAIVFTALFSMGMLPLFFVFLLQDTGKTLIVSAAAYFIMIFLMNGAQADWFVYALPIGQLRRLPLNTLSLPVPAMLGIDWAGIAVMAAGAYACFRRCDLK